MVSKEEYHYIWTWIEFFMSLGAKKLTGFIRETCCWGGGDAAAAAAAAGFDLVAVEMEKSVWTAAGVIRKGEQHPINVLYRQKKMK